jgi:hypothetical protein
MLKRQQILLKGWQAEAINNFAATNDLSMSEVVRCLINHGIFACGGKIVECKIREKLDFETRKFAEKRGLIE